MYNLKLKTWSRKIKCITLMICIVFVNGGALLDTLRASLNRLITGLAVRSPPLNTSKYLWARHWRVRSTVTWDAQASAYVKCWSKASINGEGCIRNGIWRKKKNKKKSLCQIKYADNKEWDPLGWAGRFAKQDGNRWSTVVAERRSILWNWGNHVLIFYFFGRCGWWCKAFNMCVCVCQYQIRSPCFIFHTCRLTTVPTLTNQSWTASELWQDYHKWKITCRHL